MWFIYYSILATALLNRNNILSYFQSTGVTQTINNIPIYYGNLQWVTYVVLQWVMMVTEQVLQSVHQKQLLHAASQIKHNISLVDKGTYTEEN